MCSDSSKNTMDQKHQQYRIVKRFSHRKDDGAAEYRYHLEYLGRTFLLGRPKWKAVTQMVCGWGDCYYQEIYFSSEDDAKEYLKNLNVPVEEESIVTTP